MSDMFGTLSVINVTWDNLSELGKYFVDGRSYKDF